MYGISAAVAILQGLSKCSKDFFAEHSHGEFLIPSPLLPCSKSNVNVNGAAHFLTAVCVHVNCFQAYQQGWTKLNTAAS